MYKQGDILVVRFPFTDGSEFKKRPALVISNNIVNQICDYLMVQITSKISTDELSVQIEDKDVLESLPLKSFVRIHKIFTVNERLILSKITEVYPSFSSKLKDSFLSIISLE